MSARSGIRGRQLDAYGERPRPILVELGINPGEPEVLEVHNIIKR